MSWFSSLTSPFTSDPVAAAKAKVEKAEKDLADAKAELEKAQSTPANTSDGVSAGGRRKRTYRNKEKRPAKRRRNGRRSIRS